MIFCIILCGICQPAKRRNTIRLASFIMKTLLFCLFFPAALSAQLSAYLNDPDILWATELSQDWLVDIPSFDMEWENGITTVKLLRTEQNEPYWNAPFLKELVFYAANNGQLPIYEDAAFSKRVTDAARLLYRLDTIVTFDPETYEERVKVIRNEVHLTNTWRLVQVLAYHRKSATWSTTAEAIAPLVVVRNAVGDSVGTQPLFWFWPESRRPKLNSRHVVWAKKVVNKQPGTEIATVPAHPVKMTEGSQSPLPHLLQVMASDNKIPFYDSWNEKPLSISARNAILVKTDTIITFDTETYEERVRIVRNDINPDNIRQLRTVQSWYWDERSQRLHICLDAVAPLMDVMDDMGNFRYQIPLFYRRARK